MITASAPVRLRLTATVNHTIYLPGYAGSTLRGAFGHALRALSCTTRQRDCTGCPLSNTCPYPAVFAPRFIQTTETVSNAALLRDDTPPYSIEPYIAYHNNPLAAQYSERELLAGETLSFGMVIWGAAREQLPLIIMAWQRALARGIGLRPKLYAADADCEPAPHEPERLPMGNAQLNQIDALDEYGYATPLWSIDTPSIHQAALHAAQYQAQTPLQSPEELVNGCTLRLHSPLRINQNNAILTGKQLTSVHVLQALLRRCKTVGLLNQSVISELPRILEANLRLHARVKWWDTSRYSASQQQATPLGGLTGYLDFVGDMRPYWSLLHAGQFIHIGKECVFGLGGYSVLPLRLV
jgi:hypothetical protein